MEWSNTEDAIEPPRFTVTKAHQLISPAGYYATSFFRTQKRTTKGFYKYVESLDNILLHFPTIFPNWILVLYIDASLENPNYTYPKNEARIDEATHWSKKLKQLSSNYYFFVEVVTFTIDRFLLKSGPQPYYHDALFGMIARHHAIERYGAESTVAIRDLDAHLLHADFLQLTNFSQQQEYQIHYYLGRGYGSKKGGHMTPFYNNSKNSAKRDVVPGGLFAVRNLGSVARQLIEQLYIVLRDPTKAIIQIGQNARTILNKFKYGCDEIVLNHHLIPFLVQRNDMRIMPILAYDVYKPNSEGFTADNLVLFTGDDGFAGFWKSKTGLVWDPDAYLPIEDDEYGTGPHNGFVSDLVYEYAVTTQNMAPETILWDSMLSDKVPIFRAAGITILVPGGQVVLTTNELWLNRTLNWFYQQTETRFEDYRLVFSRTHDALTEATLTAYVFEMVAANKPINLEILLVPRDTRKAFDEIILCSICDERSTAYCQQCLSRAYCSEECATRDWEDARHFLECKLKF